MNETIKVIKTRRSIRKYLSKQIEPEILKQILDARTYAPTGKGAQAPVIVVYQDKDKIKELEDLNRKIMGAPENYSPFYGAPTVILVIAKNCFTAVQDGSAVLTTLADAAWSLGIGSCWIHRAKEEMESEYGKKLLKSLNLDGDYIGVGHLILGYPDETIPEAKPRKDNYIIYNK